MAPTPKTKGVTRTRPSRGVSSLGRGTPDLGGTGVFGAEAGPIPPDSIDKIIANAPKAEKGVLGRAAKAGGKASLGAEEKAALREVNQILARGNVTVPTDFRALGESLAAQRDAIVAGAAPERLALPAGSPGGALVPVGGNAVVGTPGGYTLTNVRALPSAVGELGGGAPATLGQAALGAGSPGGAATPFVTPAAAAQAAAGANPASLAAAMQGASAGGGGVAPSGFLTGFPGAVNGAASAATSPSAGIWSKLTTLSNWQKPAGMTGRFQWMAINPTAAQNGTLGEGLWGGRLAAGSVGRAGAYGLAGQIGAKATEALWNDPNSHWDNAAATAAAGAGAGAGIGSMIFPGPGTAVGAAVGALGGGLYGYFRSGSAKSDYENTYKKEREKLLMSGRALGLNGDALAEMARRFDQGYTVLKAQNGNNPDRKTLKNYASNLLAYAPTAVDEQRQLSSATQRALATQAAIGEYMKPYMANMQQSADYAANLYDNLAKSTSGSVADSYKALGASTRSGAANLAAAYSQQTQAIPQVYAQNLVQQYRASKGQPYSDLLSTNFPAIQLAAQ